MSGYVLNLCTPMSHVIIVVSFNLFVCISAFSLLNVSGHILVYMWMCLYSIIMSVRMWKYVYVQVDVGLCVCAMFVYMYK